MIRRQLAVEIRARGEKTAPVFDIAFTHADPAVAADVVRDITSRFIDENLKDRAQQATATAEFLDQELQRLRDEVTKQEERIREFRMEKMGALPSQLETNLRSLDRLNLELAGNLEAQEAGTQRLALLRQQRANVRVRHQPRRALDALLRPQRGAPGAAAGAARLHGRASEREAPARGGGAARGRAEQRRGRTPPAPDFSSHDPALVALDSEAAAASLELEGRRRQEARIRQEIEQFQGRVEETPRREQEELELTRDYENLMATYRSLLTKKYEASLARNLEQAQKGERFKVLRPVSVPKRPSWPDLRILLPAGLARGPAAGRPAGRRRRVPPSGLPLGRTPDADARAAGLRLDPAHRQRPDLREPAVGRGGSQARGAHGARVGARGAVPRLPADLPGDGGLSRDPGDERRARRRQVAHLHEPRALAGVRSGTPGAGDRRRPAPPVGAPAAADPAPSSVSRTSCAARRSSASAP